MQLQSIANIEPKKYGYFLHSSNTALTSHPNSYLISFATRQSEVMLYNRRTSRCSCIYRSDSQIVYLEFTQQHLLIAQKGVHEILVFSLKSEKLKKKITGHRSQVMQLAYCKQRNMFASISHDVCMVWNEHTLTNIKTLKCSTSSFSECLFGLNGQYFLTAFKDSTVFIWNLDSFQHRQVSFDMKHIKIATNYSSYLVVYNSDKIQIGDLTTSVVSFNDLDVFWDQPIDRVDFLDELLVVQCGKKLYIAELGHEHRVVVKKVKNILDPISEYRIGCHGSIILLVSADKTKLSLMSVCIQREGRMIKMLNPLTNTGLYCAGGYQNSNECPNNNQLYTYPYSINQHQLQNITVGTYNVNTSSFSKEKLEEFIRKHHILPEKHRALAYKYLLNLPINAKQYKQLQAMGRHECVEMLEAKYPLKERKLSQSMKDVISLLAHYDSIFSECDQIPSIVFPFVCLFGNDRFLCFEILYRLFTNWLNFLFKDFPAGNADYIQNIHQIMQACDLQLLNHLKHMKLSFTKLTWGLISNLFTTTLPREAFLSLVDMLFVNHNKPQMTMFITIGYLVYNRNKILKFKSDEDIEYFINSEHTVNNGKFIKIYQNLYQKYRKLVTYNFRQVDLQQRNYIQYGGYPKEAVRMYQGRRKLQTEEYRKTMDQLRYHQEINREMTKMAIEAKRQAEKQQIKAETYIFHSQNQSNNIISIPHPNRALRIEKLKSLTNKLADALKSSQHKKEIIKGYLPIINCNFDNKKDSELQQAECQLMELLSQFKPTQFNKPLHSQPFPLKKNKIDDHKDFKAAKNAQMANQLWSLQNIDVGNQQKSWSNDVLRSMKI